MSGSTHAPAVPLSAPARHPGGGTPMVGSLVGPVGTAVGALLGLPVFWQQGMYEPLFVGQHCDPTGKPIALHFVCREQSPPAVGDGDGTPVGKNVGEAVGDVEGTIEGSDVGASVDPTAPVGASVGTVGDAEGEMLGL